MSQTNNDRSTQGRLRTGLIASGERLDLVAPAVQACPLLELTGQSGMPQAAALPKVPWLDDWRVLMDQADLQAILLATTTRNDAELGAMAAQRGLHVWRLPPLARSFAEAAEIAGNIKRHATIYRLASWWEHVADHVWHELDWPENFQPLFSDLRISAVGPVAGSWRTSMNEAGGGVLANDGYAQLEALVAVRGLPESVSAAVGSCRPQPGGAAGDAEDTALAILRYSGGGMAAVRATWNLPPIEQQLLHHGQVATVRLTGEEASVSDADGGLRDRHPLSGDYLASDLHRFVQWVGGDARDRAAEAVERHLAISALLDTVYLSARTGHPESPRKFYEVQGWPLPRS